VILADKGVSSPVGRGSDAEHGRLIGYAMTPSAHD
jgi:hypothetical protein